jgi:release factor glutamine methyltransferase
VTLQAALAQGQRLLEEARVAAPRLTAEVLLAHAVGRDRTWLYAHSDEELRELWWIHYGRYLHDRLNGKPTQYITGHREFYGRDFQVTPDVLIPRPETEHVVEAALARASGARTIADIGAGSGAIAITMALETARLYSAKATVIATDISERALAVAARNARRLDAAARSQESGVRSQEQSAGVSADGGVICTGGVRFVLCDLGSALEGNVFDLVLSNPPYVPESASENIQKEVRDWEPRVALFGGRDGLDVVRRLIPDAWRLLRSGGFLIMEIGWSTAEKIQAMLSKWQDLETKADLAGIPRVIIARKP